jgi:hypothetical protein
VGSEWSFAQIKIPTKFTQTKAICVKDRVFACCDNNLVAATVADKGGLLAVDSVKNLFKE